MAVFEIRAGAESGTSLHDIIEADSLSEAASLAQIRLERRDLELLYEQRTVARVSKDGKVVIVNSSSAD